MIKIVVIFLIFLSSQSYSQVIDSLLIDSKIMNDKRRILIYIPESYKYNPEKRYEVTYVLDAQSRMFFDYVHSVQDFISENQTIVIGISSTWDESRLQSRNTDFLPKPIHRDPKTYFNGYLGNADNFSKFIREEVFAYVEKTYRTLPFRIGIGHSNGATFMLYNMLTNPDMFDANFLLSPNLAYDDEQLVEKLAIINPENLAGKFVYMCNGNEDYKGWIAAREKAISIFKKYADKITFVNDDFSATEGHMTCFLPGFISGWRHFLDYKFHSAATLIPYYKKLDQQKLVTLTPELLNGFAYGCLNAGKIDDGIEILRWALVKFPEDANLYDSMGEMQQKKGNTAEALKFYKLALKKIESQKEKLQKDRYEELKKNAKDRIAYLEGK